MTLPINPSGVEMDAYVANIVATYRKATPHQLARGALWYWDAREIAERCPLGVRVGAGIIAALSPQKSWPLNVILAEDAFTGYVHGQVGDATRKVEAILAGSDPKDVLPMHAKTGQFFLCVANPMHPSAVVIDRHAHDVAAGMRPGSLEERGLSAKGRYDSLVRAYRCAATEVGILPCVLQAITWTVQVEKFRWKRGV